MTAAALTARRIAPVEVREASLEDYQQITELESRHGLQEKKFEEWKHLWMNNPVYRRIAKSWPLGWVLEDADRKIVGYVGNIPLSYEFDGKQLLAATSRAWVADLQYRSYSVLLLDYFFAQGKVDLYLTTSLNTEAFKGFQFFEPSPVPVGDWDRCRFWVTNPVGLLASWFAMKGIPFGKSLSYPSAIPLLIKDHLAGRRFGQNSSPGEIQFCSGFDDRFDAFWKQLQRSRFHVLLGARTREVLEWHFGPGLLAGKVWILCVTNRQRLVAYSIFYRQDNPKFGLKRVRLADFQTLASDNSLLLPMLSCALERCRCTGVHMLEVMGLCPQKTQLIAELAPYWRKLSSWLSYYKTNNPQLAESLKDPRIWDPSCFDGDSSL